MLFVFRPDGVVVPLGTSKDTGVSNPMGYTLNYNGTYAVQLYLIIMLVLFCG